MHKLCTKTKEIWDESEIMFERAGQDIKAVVNFGTYSKQEFDKLSTGRSVVHYFEYIIDTRYVENEWNEVIKFLNRIPDEQIMIFNQKNLLSQKYKHCI